MCARARAHAHATKIWRKFMDYVLDRQLKMVFNVHFGFSLFAIRHSRPFRVLLAYSFALVSIHSFGINQHLRLFRKSPCLRMPFIFLLLLFLLLRCCFSVRKIVCFLNGLLLVELRLLLLLMPEEWGKAAQNLYVYRFQKSTSLWERM